jgi:non-ribosomal peptide synthetase component E (peptide arylation enzyme)
VNIALPGFAWMYGRWCNLLSGALDGATNVVVDPFTPAGVIDALRREKPTHIHGAPAIYHALMDGIMALRDAGDLSLEAFHYAGSVMPFEMARRLRETAQLLTCYGLSEISPVCGNSIMDSPEAQIRSSGRPAWGNQVALMGADRKRVGIGEEGEVAVRGPGLTLGYLDQPEANAQAFIADGFFLTGDLGYFDDANNLNITGRSKDVIDRGGIKFSPREVEELLLGHASVANVAVVAMPDPKLGERSCAFVVARPGKTINLNEAVSYLKGKGLATHKLPERIELIDALPVTATGKVQKYRLRQQVAERLRDPASTTSD